MTAMMKDEKKTVAVSADLSTLTAKHQSSV
jgi:hypothetical protein